MNRSMKGTTYLGALCVLQTLLQNSYDRICLQIHDQVGRSCKHPERSFSETRIGVLSHGECLYLESMPRSTAFHGVVGEIGDGIDGFPPDDDRGFMEECAE